MDWSLYWFMFPLSICVATTAMLSEIGTAALFIPIFVIIIPILGPEYPTTAAAAIGTALMTEVFGFSSEFVGYYRKRLIDFSSAIPFICVAVPIPIIGSLMLALLKEQETFLKAAYTILMLVLCPVILKHTPPPPSAPEEAARQDGPDRNGRASDRPARSITARPGETYSYPAPRIGLVGNLNISIGAFLTELLGAGIGEVIVPQLVKRNHVPVAVAAATSVFTVIVTIASTSFTQVTALISAGGVNAIPWNVVCYTIPAVIIRGQIGPWLQGHIAQRTMEKVLTIYLA